MSGSMPAPQGGMPQLPPQVLQALMQRMAQGGGGGGAPQGGPPGMPPPGPGGPPPGPGGPPGAPPQQAGPPQPPPGGLPPPGMQAAQQMAASGRMGDTIAAHVTPGEISIPPQVQTPELIKAIQAAFAKFNIDPAQFTAGSPTAAKNPQTGAPELSLWSALLPIAGAAAGSFIPGIGTAAGMGIGGALGGAAGGALDHTGGAGIALQALGGGAGGYLGGVMGGAPSGLAGTAEPTTASMAASGANPFNSGAFGPAGLGPELSGGYAGAASAAPSSMASGLSSIPMKGVVGAGLGSTIGSMLTPPPSQSSSAPPGFNDHMKPVDPNFNQLRGAGTVSTPQFAGYNPYQAVSGPNPGFNFFPRM